MGRFRELSSSTNGGGLNDPVKEQAAKPADQGYAALAIDLYRGKVADNPGTAHELARGVPEDLARSACCGRVPATPAEREEGLDRFDGMVHGRRILARRGTAGSNAYCHSAILGNFAGLDQGIPPDDVKKFATALKQAGKQTDIKIYPEAGHAFQNRTTGPATAPTIRPTPGNAR